ncbi:histidine phosphatase family protein [Halobacillus litoralis]|uniref:histidine phosphatase family protein n=1 Tax=Halobacillus litoralis TaxID=45668 RepID=UPI001CD6AFA0|nr:histidine phosphatase family protein [Halobacillus litoralis]MCA0971702.1 histidine phosphatase family protein [Halobacillus litoralis]
MTRLGIIRHGSTQWNKERRAQGSSDIPLDEEGKREAEKLASRLAEEQWDRIYTSPLSRASETARIIQEQLQVPLVEDARLVEVGGGQVEGTTEEERIEKWGPDWRDLDLGAERKEQFLHRGKQFVEDMLVHHKGEKILVVSHGALISHLIRDLIEGDVLDGHIHNTSISEIVDSTGRWSLETFNCVEHLEF